MYTVSWLQVSLEEICNVVIYVSNMPVFTIFPERLSFYLLISADMYCKCPKEEI